MKYLIIGASAAGLNCAKKLRELDKDSSITVASIDENIYSRCMLHLYVGQERDMDSLAFVDKDFFENNNINWIKGVAAKKLDTKNKTVSFDNGNTEEYDKLLIATGSSAMIPPIKTEVEQDRGIFKSLFNIGEIETVKGSNLSTNVSNVFVLRTIEDAKGIETLVDQSKTAIVVGGGLLGIDIATELMSRGLKVHIVEMGDHILPLQLDETAAKTYADIILEKGSKIHTGVLAEKAILDTNNNLKSIVLNNGEVIDTDLVVVAAGVRANTDFMEDTDIEIDRGIVVNKKCETNKEDIYAAGDVCAGKPGIWPLATKQGIVAAHNMAGLDKEMDNLFGFKNSMNFFGINSISLGIVNIDESRDDYNDLVVEILDDGKSYKKVIHKDGVIEGVVLQEDLTNAGVYNQLIIDKFDTRKLDKNVLNIGYEDFFELDEKKEFQYKEI